MRGCVWFQPIGWQRTGRLPDFGIKGLIEREKKKSGANTKVTGKRAGNIQMDSDSERFGKLQEFLTTKNLNYECFPIKNNALCHFITLVTECTDQWEQLLK